VARLSQYKNALVRLKSLGFVKVFSDNLADALGIRPTQVRKDFSLFQISGNKRGGYNIHELLDRILTLLGKTETQEVVLVGLGHMGMALAKYTGFRKEGIHICACFDIDPAKHNPQAQPPIFPMEKLVETVDRRHIRIAVVAVPDIAAQRVADLLAAAGIKGILNFAPIQLRTPTDVEVRNVNLVQELENLFYFVRAEEV
jgi:redox-sensing transcriptional repressor